MSTLIDDLLQAELPDKVTIKYKPSRMRKLLKQLAELISANTRTIRIDQKIATLAPSGSSSVTHVTGVKSVIKRIVFNEYGQPSVISVNDTFKLSCNSEVLYDGPLAGAMTIPGKPLSIFGETDILEFHIESSSVEEHNFAVAIIMEEVS